MSRAVAAAIADVRAAIAATERELDALRGRWQLEDRPAVVFEVLMVNREQAFVREAEGRRFVPTATLLALRRASALRYLGPGRRR